MLEQESNNPDVIYGRFQGGKKERKLLTDWMMMVYLNPLLEMKGGKRAAAVVLLGKSEELARPPFLPTQHDEMRSVQGSAKRFRSGCMNAPGKVRQKW